LNLITVEGEFPKILIDFKLILWRNIDKNSYIKNFVNKIPAYPEIVYQENNKIIFGEIKEIFNNSLYMILRSSKMMTDYFE
jgi:hypothetical protein